MSASGSDKHGSVAVADRAPTPMGGCEGSKGEIPPAFSRVSGDANADPSHFHGGGGGGDGSNHDIPNYYTCMDPLRATALRGNIKVVKPLTSQGERDMALSYGEAVARHSADGEDSTFMRVNNPSVCSFKYGSVAGADLAPTPMEGCEGNKGESPSAFRTTPRMAGGAEADPSHSHEGGGDGDGLA